MSNFEKSVLGGRIKANTFIIFVYLLFLAFNFITISSCKSEKVWESDFFTEIDSIRIKPYLRSIVDKTKKEFSITISDSISFNEIRNAISHKNSPVYLCGYTGSVEIFKNDSIKLRAVYNHECNTIVFHVPNKERAVYKRITRDGIDILTYYADIISDSLHGQYVRTEKLK